MFPLSTHLFSHWSIPLNARGYRKLMWFSLTYRPEFRVFFIFQTWAFWARWYWQPFSSLPGGQSTQPAWGPCTTYRWDALINFQYSWIPCSQSIRPAWGPCTTYRWDALFNFQYSWIPCSQSIRPAWGPCTTYRWDALFNFQYIWIPCSLSTRPAWGPFTTYRWDALINFQYSWIPYSQSTRPACELMYYIQRLELRRITAQKTLVHLWLSIV